MNRTGMWESALGRRGSGGAYGIVRPSGWRGARGIVVWLAWAAWAALAGARGGAQASPPGEAPAAPGEALVKLSEPIAESLLQAPGGTVEKQAAPVDVSSLPAALREAAERFGFRGARRLDGSRAEGGESEIRNPKLEIRNKAQELNKSEIRNPKSETDPRDMGKMPVPLNVYRLQFDPGADVGEVCEFLRGQPGVLVAEPNYICRPCYAPNDPLYAEQTADLSRIGIEEAWAVQRGSASIKVAVLDTGIDLTHEDLAGVVLAGYDFVDNETSADDDNGHGTRVAGIIGAIGNNSKGVAGVAFGVRLIPYDVASPTGSILTSDAIEALNYATGCGAHVVNMSFRTYGYSVLFEQACAAAAQTAVLVAGAGNENQGDRRAYPAGYDSVIGVGATDEGCDARAAFSNYNGLVGDLVELAAPGTTVFSTFPGSDYNGSFGTGTSFSAPIVSGVAALLRSKYPGQSPGAIRARLRSTATPIGAWAGSGLVNASAALGAAMAPEFAVESTAVDDALAYSPSNNADGRWQNGETVRLIVRLRNAGADATTVTATLSTADALATVGDAAGGWGHIANGQSKAATDPFDTVALAPASGAHSVVFSLSIVANGGAYSQALPFGVAAENLFTPPPIIATDTTWTSDTTYLIEANTVVMAGAKLTIEPGTTVKFADIPGQTNGLEIRGTIDAAGAAGKRITFTSADDLPGGGSGFKRYGGVNVVSSATSAEFAHCRFQFAPVTDESSVATFADCLFDRTGEDGSLYTPNGANPVVRCAAIGNAGGRGIRAGAKNLIDCVAQDNMSTGLAGGALEGCSAARNGSGMWGSSALDCEARDNAGNGIYSTGPVSHCFASGNGNWGIAASDDVENTSATLNGNGIQGGAVRSSKASMNSDSGIFAAGEARDCRAEDNGGVGIAASQLTGCTVAGNGHGLSLSGTASGCTIAQNAGPGVSGGMLENSVVRHNQGLGAAGCESVTNSWIVGNAGNGVESAGSIADSMIRDNWGIGAQGKAGAPYTTIANSTIRMNSGSGVRNSGTMNGCNLYGNGGAHGYDYEDGRLSSELAQVDVTGNYWGPETTPLMNAHPWGSYFDIPRIYDFVDDTNLCEARYAGHRAAEIPTARPGDAAPAFLLEVVPNLDNAVNSELTSFTLTFSKAMNTAADPTVTFDLAAPYTGQVVAPAPGWMSDYVWRGVYGVTSSTGEGIHTIRVSGARAAPEPGGGAEGPSWAPTFDSVPNIAADLDEQAQTTDAGFQVPDDTAHAFLIDTCGGIIANNGLATGTGPHTMSLSWNAAAAGLAGKGYDIQRSATLNLAAFQKINASPVQATTHGDSGLQSGTRYYYIVYAVDSNNNATQHTSVFYGQTQGAPPGNGVGESWRKYK